ncbi:hypothetical protein FGG65_gp50 [Corynebacterium phage phi673]|uniref:Uncharacterized protein n=1 Tax=Corynebacterium phage phi673 TaxID=2052821 RepID=A0A2H4PIV4_9CAUD|nr:hypothetical protein FGG65_gp50 [Corynebacterium phage phi673]ATW62912.1 hypothetical protein phi673_gp50 [Corynebacterium phage phi673]
MSINDNIKHMGGLSGSPEDKAHEEALRMNERIQRSVDMREDLKDHMPEVGATGWYAAPHMLQVHHNSPNGSTVIVMSREQVLHLVVELMNWLTDNLEDGAL